MAENENHRVAIVVSRFNPEITDKLVEGALAALKQSGADPAAIPVYRVPGAFEIPLIAKLAALSGKFDAVIALGCVIRGETPHFEYISNQVSLGLGKAALESGIPITFGVLTVDTDAQAEARSGPGTDNKGYEAAMAAVEMIQLARQF